MLLLAAFLLLPSASAEARRYASIVIDADSGEVLHARHPDRKAYPASLTKMMTLYMAFEALERGLITLDQPLKVSKRAAKMPPSKLRLKVGGTITVRDAILALVTKSANDVAVVMAEALGGTESRFARLMTEKARQLGMSRTVFRNASGLPNSKQLSTASDMAKLAQALLNDFPRQYRYFSTRTFKFRGRNYRNHNNLLKNFKGTDGIKTGYTHASGYNLVASAVRGDRRLIGVVFGGKTARSRDRHMRKLLGQGFKKAARVRIEPLDSPPPRKPLVLQAMLPTASEPADAVTRPPKTEAPAAAATATAMLGGSVVPVPVRRPSPVPNPPSPDRIPMRLDSLVEQGSTTLGAGETQERRDDDSPPAPIFKPIRSGLDPSAGPASHWGVQVGAYRHFASAQLAAQKASRQATKHLVEGRVAIHPVKASNGEIFRARIIGVSEQDARLACAKLRQFKMPCHVVPPNRS